MHTSKTHTAFIWGPPERTTRAPDGARGRPDGSNRYQRAPWRARAAVVAPGGLARWVCSARVQNKTTFWVGKLRRCALRAWLRPIVVEGPVPVLGVVGSSPCDPWLSSFLHLKMPNAYSTQPNTRTRTFLRSYTPSGAPAAHGGVRGGTLVCVQPLVHELGPRTRSTS